MSFWFSTVGMTLLDEIANFRPYGMIGQSSNGLEQPF